MKPASSEGSKGFRIITDEKVDILNERPGTAKICWELLRGHMEQYDEMPDILIMEYLPGTEYSVDCVCKDGETIVCIPRQRMATSMGIATECIIEKNGEIIDISKRIIKDLNLSYNINLQFKYSREGKPKLVEINPRVSGPLVANLGAGVNMLELSLKLAYGLPLPSIDVKWGTKMMRYWDHIYRERNINYHYAAFILTLQIRTSRVLCKQVAGIVILLKPSETSQSHVIFLVNKLHIHIF